MGACFRRIVSHRVLACAASELNTGVYRYIPVCTCIYRYIPVLSSNAAHAHQASPSYRKSSPTKVSHTQTGSTRLLDGLQSGLYICYVTSGWPWRFLVGCKIVRNRLDWPIDSTQAMKQHKEQDEFSICCCCSRSSSELPEVWVTEWLLMQWFMSVVKPQVAQARGASWEIWPDGWIL